MRNNCLLDELEDWRPIRSVITDGEQIIAYETPKKEGGKKSKSRLLEVRFEETQPSWYLWEQ
jgi:hypothetical protein